MPKKRFSSKVFFEWIDRWDKAEEIINMLAHPDAFGILSENGDAEEEIFNFLSRLKNTEMLAAALAITGVVDLLNSGPDGAGKVLDLIEKIETDSSLVQVLAKESKIDAECNAATLCQDENLAKRVINLLETIEGEIDLSIVLSACGLIPRLVEKGQRDGILRLLTTMESQGLLAKALSQPGTVAKLADGGHATDVMVFIDPMTGDESLDDILSEENIEALANNRPDASLVLRLIERVSNETTLANIIRSLPMTQALIKDGHSERLMQVIISMDDEDQRRRALTRGVRLALAQAGFDRARIFRGENLTEIYNTEAKKPSTGSSTFEKNPQSGRHPNRFD